ncbi:MAG: hypothetical protein IJS44_06285 [Clostridia bacterium]|nr:hypothetical protein [Clostridia bacterium]
MKHYEKPTLAPLSISLSDLILTSAEAPAFNIDADKTAGQANWLAAWNELL